MSEKPVLYVFVRQDLTKPQVVVQACHAVAKASECFQPPACRIVVFGIRSVFKLGKTQEYLHECNIKYTSFHECDMNNELTALATEPIYDDIQRKLLSKYKLLWSDDKS